MKQFVTPHSHIRSFDSASSPEKFAARLTEMGNNYITITDHGTLEGTRQVYDLTKDKYKNLSPILGVEAYFRDDNCALLKAAGAVPDEKDGTLKKFMKYAHLTLHAQDEKAYSVLSRLLSNADLRAERHGSERKPLFDWSNLEELGAYNITATSSCLIGVVSRHLLDRNDTVTATRYYERVRGCFKPGNFYVEMFPHRCDRNWESKVIVTDSSDTKHEFQNWNQVKTRNSNEGIRAEDLAKEFMGAKRKSASERHIEIVEVMQNRVWNALPVPVTLKNVEQKEGWEYNECLPWCPDGDVQLGANKFILELANKYNDPVMPSDDSHFAYQSEKITQDVRLGQNGSWRFSNSHHLLSSDEVWPYFRDVMGIPEVQFEGWVQNSLDWASRFKDFSFTPRKSLPVSFYPQDTLKHTLSLIEQHGRMDWKNKEWVDRLEAEINLLHRNGTVDLLPYFFIDEEVCRLYAQNGKLTGPGRGSAAGLLLAYLLNITHVDPLRYKLSMDRFLTVDRIKTGKMPDIDQDLGTRTLLVGDPEKGQTSGWLHERFGKDHVAQISVDSTLKLKMAIKDTFRALAREAGREAKVPPHIEEICKALPQPPQGISDKDYVFGYEDSDGNWNEGLVETNAVLKKFMADYPKEWSIVQTLLGLVRQKAAHPCGFLISNDPIHDYIPLQTIGENRVTSFAPAQVEAAGGLKMDFLVIDILKDIEMALNLIRENHGGPDSDLIINGKKVPAFRTVKDKNGNFYDIYDLPRDKAVYDDICRGKVTTVFQLDAAAAKQGLKEFAPLPDGTLPLNDLEGLSAFTALDRPGPLDARVQNSDGIGHNMLVEFANRAKMKERIGEIPVLNEMLPETFGTIVFQEQLQFIFQKIGGTTAVEADKFRQRIGKKKMVDVNKIDKPLFLKGAIQTLGEPEALRLWEMMETFGQYGFNKSMDGRVILPFDGGFKQIREFTGGETVKCLDEFGNLVDTKVIALHDHGVLPGFEIEFDDGETIVTTANHKFLTEAGQKPIYDIINNNRSVWSRLQINDDQSAICPPEEVRSASSKNWSTLQRGVEGSLWGKTTAIKRSQTPSQDLSFLHSNQEIQHSNTSAKAQHPTGTKSSLIDCGSQDVCSTGYSAGTRSKTAQMASGKSRKNSLDLGIGKKGNKSFQNGSLAAVEYDVNLARRPYPLWRGEEAGGFRQLGRKNLGRSGRVLPLFRSIKEETPACDSSIQRCDAKSGSDSSWRCDIDSFSWTLFQNLGWKNEAGMAQLAYSDAPIPQTRGLVLRRIVRVRYVGERRMYDLEVAHPKHNFLLPNGVVTSNSHAICYMDTAYACAWLKHHYPLEWWCSVLCNAKDRNEINEKFWAHCGHLIDLPDISFSKENFVIENGRIRAPLNLIKGLGENAHAQLLSLGSFVDIEDLLVKIEQWKIDNATVKVNQETGEKKLVKARSAINSTGIQNLIIAGALDSLFPKQNEIGQAFSLEEKLNAYNNAVIRVNKKKKGTPIANKDFLSDPLFRYQLQKDILPAFSSPLAPILKQARPDLLTEGNRYVTEVGHGSFAKTVDWHVINGTQFENLKNAGPISKDLSVCVLGYVVGERKFDYTDKKTGEHRYATELVIDMDGVRNSVVKWGGSKGLSDTFKQELTGAIIGGLFLRRQNATDWYFADAVVLAPAINRGKEESSV